MAFSPDYYGPVASAFLDGSRGAADLGLLTPSELFPHAPFPREALSGLWLFLDDLDRSHAISQDLSTPEASFWHFIMHRREPDPSNAAYWFRRVGRHAVFPPCAKRSPRLATGWRVPNGIRLPGSTIGRRHAGSRALQSIG